MGAWAPGPLTAASGWLGLAAGRRSGRPQAGRGDLVFTLCENRIYEEKVGILNLSGLRSGGTICVALPRMGQQGMW